MLKKLVSIVLTIAMLCSVVAVNVIADGEETLCQQAGIADDLTANKVIKLDGNKAGANPTLLANNQVINYGDSIGVFSAPYDTDYAICAASLRSVLLGATVYGAPGTLTSKGYDLKYYAPNTTEPAADDTIVVGGGFVRATKEGSTHIDIPVVDTEELIYLDGSQISVGGSFTGGSKSNQSTGIAGKAFDDKALEIEIDKGATPGDSRITFVKEIKSSHLPKTVVTVEFSICVTGDVKAYIESSMATIMNGYTADGTMSYYSYDSGAKVVDTKVCDNAATWHNIAITYDYVSNRIRYYFDGNLINVKGRLTSTGDLDYLQIGVVKNVTYENGGSVAIDDVKVTRGYYNPNGRVVTAKKESDKIVIDTANKTVTYSDPSLTADIIAFEFADCTDASEAKIYADDTLMAYAEGNVTNSNVIVAKTASKNINETYTLVYHQLPLCQQAGIADDLTANKVIKLDGNKAGANPTLLANNQVINYGDSIGVFSAPYDKDYAICAASLRSVLLGATVYGAPGTLTSKGYDLKYYAPNTTEPAADDTIVVGGGFVRATKEGSTHIDIPVVDTEELIYLDGSQISVGGSFTGGSKSNQSTGIAGKAFDDKALEIKIDKGATPGDSRITFVNGIKSSHLPKTVVTVEFSICVTGDVKAYIESSMATIMDGYTADGTMSYYSYDSGAKVVDTKVCDNAATWHNIAITYDYVSNRIRYYFDGNLINVKGRLTTTGDLDYLQIGVVKNVTYENGGSVAIDNVKVSRGYYSSEGSTISAQSSSNAYIDTVGKKIYFASSSIDEATIKNLTDCANAAIYTDETLTQRATTVSDGCAIVLTTANKVNTEIYIAEEIEGNMLVVAQDGQSIVARPIFAVSDGILMIARYDSSGALDELVFGTDSNYASIEVVEGSYTYKAMLWKDIESQIPYFKAVSYPAK